MKAFQIEKNPTKIFANVFKIIVIQKSPFFRQKKNKPTKNQLIIPFDLLKTEDIHSFRLSLTFAITSSCKRYLYSFDQQFLDQYGSSLIQ